MLEKISEWKPLTDPSHEGGLVMFGWWDKKREEDSPRCGKSFFISIGCIYDARNDVDDPRDFYACLHHNIAGSQTSFDIELRDDELPTHWFPLPAPLPGWRSQK